MILQGLIGLGLGMFIGWLAYRAGSLSVSGAYAAALTGGLIFGLGGLSWAVLLLTFFVSSSALSKAFHERKALLNEKFSKGSRRDWGQVFANGGLGAGLAVIHAVYPQAGWVWPAFVGTMAAVNADTWATELGVLSGSAPRLITSGRQVERGTSGAISRLGTLAALGGAGLIGLAAALFEMPNGWGAVGGLLLAALIGGLGGSLFDSLLGATVQAIYRCPACDKETERHPKHVCGTETTRIRGWAWMDNDWVNFLASLTGALIAVAIMMR
jgi:uncharacterized protein (TIGR00297 family)